MSGPIATDDLQVVKRHRTASIIRRVAWVHFKLSLAVWALVFILVPPTTTINVVNNVAWLVVCLIGALTSTAGLILGFWSKWRSASIFVELTGMALMIVGPFVYFTTQVSLINSGDAEVFQQRFALAFFAWAMIAAILARLSEVIPRFHRKNTRGRTRSRQRRGK